MFIQRHYRRQLGVLWSVVGPLCAV